MELINICEDCFEATIPECVAEILIGGFPANGPVILYVENFHGKKNARDLLADADGVITLPYDQFGKGFFSSENSPFIFSFKEAVDACDDLSFTQCVDGESKSFFCLAVDFIKVNDPALFNNSINCQCVTVGPAPAEPDNTRP